MNNRDLLHTLSGCKFYQEYLESQKPAERLPAKPKKAAPPDRPLRRRRSRRVYRKYCLLIAALLAGAVLLVIAPLWLVHPPYGKAFLLSMPPMILCAFSWMAGAWWAWDRDRYTFMAVTLGATPARLFLALGWAWLVLSIPDVPFFVFVLGLMWHWLIFTVPELAMMHELGQMGPTKRTSPKDVAAGSPSEPSEVSK